MSVFFSKNGSTLSLNKRGEDEYRLALQKPSAQSASLDLTKEEALAVYEGLKKALFAKPTPVDGKFAQGVLKALTAYAAERNTTIETVDKEVSASRVFDKSLGKERAMTRAEWLADKLGVEDLEKVVAGKMSVSEALANNEEVEIVEEEAAPPPAA